MDLYKDMLSDISNFAIVVFGFCISLYTLIYSFLLSKIDQLNELSENIKAGELIINKTQKETNYKNYILRMKKINSYNIYCLWVSLIIYLLALIIKYLKFEEIQVTIGKLKLTILSVYILAFLAFFLLFFIGVLLINSLKIYERNTKI